MSFTQTQLLRHHKNQWICQLSADHKAKSYRDKVGNILEVFEHASKHRIVLQVTAPEPEVSLHRIVKTTTLFSSRLIVIKTKSSKRESS